MSFEHDFGQIIEGMCPRGHGKLANDGGCAPCHVWWTASTCTDPRDIALFGARKCGWSVKPPAEQIGG